jgi:hypothetical protein
LSGVSGVSSATGGAIDLGEVTISVAGSLRLLWRIVLRRGSLENPSKTAAVAVLRL